MSKILKRLLAVIGILVLLLLLAAVIIPIAFKGKIVEYAKSEANRKINATLNFDDDISLSIFSSFPNLTIVVKNLKIVNKAPFAGDTLLALPRFSATLDIMSIIRGKKIQVRNIMLDHPRIMAHVLKNGKSNWDITFPNKDSLASKGQDTTSNFRMGLKHYEIDHAYIVYNDESSDMYAIMDDMTHSGSGDFTKDIFDLDTKTNVEKATYKYGGVAYLSKVKSRLDAKLGIDNKNSKYTFKDNELQLNDLVIDFAGFLAMPGKDINMDISFKAKQTDFKSLLSLVPAVYSKDFSNLKSSGTMAFAGNVKGIYNDKAMPGFDVSLKVDNGMFQYPDLPTAIKDVFIDMQVHSPQGDMNNMVIDISKAHMAMADEPFDAHMVVKTPMGDPYVDGAIKGKIVLDNLGKVIKLDPGTAMGGMLDADLAFKGHVSTIQNKKYEDFDAKGKIKATGVTYSSKDLAEKVDISSALLSFTPKDVKLSDCKIMLGKSDISLNGSLTNMIGYVLRKNETLHGTMTMNSTFFDANPWTADNGQKAQTNAQQQKASAIQLPANIDFIFNASMLHVLYDKWDITNLKGTLVLKDRKLEFNKVNLNMLGAGIGANGFYDSKDTNSPRVQMDMTIKNLSIPEAYKSFVTVQQFAPIAKNITGNMDAQIFLDTKLDKLMNPDFSSLNSNGRLDIAKATISNFPVLQALAEKTKMDKFNNLDVKNIHPSFVITGGRFHLKEPLKFESNNIKGQVSGSNGFDKSLDYTVAMEVPSGALQGQANAAISGLLGKSVGDVVGKTISLNALIGGNIDHPTVKLDAKDAVKGVVDNLKNAVRDEFDKKKKEAEAQAQAAIDKQKQQLEIQKKAAEDQARQKADEEKKKAQDAAKKQIDQQKQNVEDQAKKRLNGLFGK